MTELQHHPCRPFHPYPLRSPDGCGCFRTRADKVWGSQLTIQLASLRYGVSFYVCGCVSCESVR